MKRQLFALVAVTLAMGCGDESYSDESLVGPVVSPKSPSKTAINAVPSPPAIGMAAIPAVGTSIPLPDSRMFWDINKAAFRAGAAGTQWDDANVGILSTAMGGQTTASGNYSVAMGYATIASGDNSTAMGSHASTNGRTGAFVFGDASTGFSVHAPAHHSFTVRASGGLNLYTSSDLSTGCSLQAGSGTWACTSDVNAKENFQDEDGEQVLAAIAAMPIQSWNYKTQDASIRHLGPIAQDFYTAFDLGIDETRINTVDIDGINMLAVQALEKRTRDLRDENEQLRATIAGLDAALQRLEAALAGTRK